ncbi:MAG: class I SAM-dependent methyltransferase [Cyclobacteriaceae bacterium]
MGDDKYFTNSRPEMDQFLPMEIKNAIEFGCGEAIFLSRVKEKFQCEAWGVDIDQNSLMKAEVKIDRCLLGNADQILTELPNNYFDCLICNDFLEHIIDPADFLRKIAPKLNAGAYLISSIPNVRYCENVFELLIKKDWKYKEAGILDRTHLRFFTKKSVQRMVDDAGFKIVRIKGINRQGGLLGSLALMLFDIISLGTQTDMKYLQFGLIAQLRDPVV